MILFKASNKYTYMISMIAAIGENNSLGKEGKLLWRLPHDLKRFKKLTLGHPVIMGRKTFETLPTPLPGRTNIIVTRQKDFSAEGCQVAHSLEEAIKLAKNADGSEEICIVGGGEIYTLGLKVADKMELTRVHEHFKDADAFFPEFDLKTWKLESEIFRSKDKKHPHNFSYLTYIRK